MKNPMMDMQKYEDCETHELCWSATYTTEVFESVSEGGCTTADKCDAVKKSIKGENIKVNTSQMFLSEGKVTFPKILINFSYLIPI